MKILGVICLILGLLGGVRALNIQRPVHGSEAYRSGYVAGRVVGPIIFISLGLVFLWQNGARKKPRQVSNALVPPPISPPRRVPIKIQCTCGQNYAFEVEPRAGQMPSPVSCPCCGVDGTAAANAVIAQSLASTVQTLLQKAPQGSAPGAKLHTSVIAIVVGAVLLVFVAGSIVRHFNSRRASVNFRSGMRPPYSPPPHFQAPSTSRGNLSPSTSPNFATNHAPLSSLNASNHPAPVPPDVTDVEILWGNRWWPGSIVQRKGAMALVHYEGWASSSDEWVAPNRLRPRP